MWRLIVYLLFNLISTAKVLYMFIITNPEIFCSAWFWFVDIIPDGLDEVWSIWYEIHISHLLGIQISGFVHNLISYSVKPVQTLVWRSLVTGWCYHLSKAHKYINSDKLLWYHCFGYNISMDVTIHSHISKLSLTTNLIRTYTGRHYFLKICVYLE